MKRPLAYITAPWSENEFENTENAAKYCRAVSVSYTHLAKAYKMKMEAIKRQGARTDLTSPKISAKFRSDDEVGQEAGVSGDTIRNYIALTQLVPELQPVSYTHLDVYKRQASGFSFTR